MRHGGILAREFRSAAGQPAGDGVGDRVRVGPCVLDGDVGGLVDGPVGLVGDVGVVGLVGVVGVVVGVLGAVVVGAVVVGVGGGDPFGPE
jgi:hypothetical protein